MGKAAVALCSSFRWESVGISVLPHIIPRRFVADIIFFCCFISCEFAVVNPTVYVQSLLFRVLHVATSCRIREMSCPPLVILCTEYYKRCLIYTPSVSSFSLPLHFCKKHFMKRIYTKKGNHQRNLEEDWEMHPLNVDALQIQDLLIFFSL